MAIEVVMPQMGESIAEGTITKWLVQVGESVERDQPLFEISTDKVDAEIPSPDDGVLLEIRHGEGETVPVDDVVGMLGKPGEALDSAPVVEETPSEPAERRLVAEPLEAGDAAVPTTGPEAAPDPDDPEAALKQRIRTHSSPLVRKMAAAEGVLSLIHI